MYTQLFPVVGGDPTFVPEIVGSLLYKDPQNKVPLIIGNSHFAGLNSEPDGLDLLLNP